MNSVSQPTSVAICFLLRALVLRFLGTTAPAQVEVNVEVHVIIRHAAARVFDDLAEVIVIAD